jgi:hypothetical protein
MPVQSDTRKKLSLWLSGGFNLLGLLGTFLGRKKHTCAGALCGVQRAAATRPGDPRGCSEEPRVSSIWGCTPRRGALDGTVVMPVCRKHMSRATPLRLTHCPAAPTQARQARPGSPACQGSPRGIPQETGRGRGPVLRRARFPGGQRGWATTARRHGARVRTHAAEPGRRRVWGR